MKKRYTITIDAEIVKRVKIRAIEYDKKLSTLIEELLCEWINDYDKNGGIRNGKTDNHNRR